jgi:type II secretion system (T2SS) protein M
MTAFAALSARERRVVLGAATLIVLSIFASRVAPAWRTWNGERRNAADRGSIEVAAARVAITTLDATRDTLAARNARYLALAPALLAGETPGAAGASLAALVSAAVADAEMKLGAMQLRVDTTLGSVFTRVSVRADAHGDVGGVTRLLLALERGPVLLAVRQIAISQPDPAAPPDRPEVLRVDFTVEGLALEVGAAKRADVATATNSRVRPSGDRGSVR